MTRVTLGLLLALAIGCTGIQPVGIMAPKGGSAKSKADKSKDDDVPKVITIPTPKPTPPANWVDPSEVTGDPHAAAQKLMSEFEADRKTIQAPPMTAEVSRIKGGVKQN